MFVAKLRRRYVHILYCTRGGSGGSRGTVVAVVSEERSTVIEFSRFF